MPWPAAQLLDLYALMLLTRALDDRQSILSRQGRQGIHLSARGHEACGAGSAVAFTPARDILVPSHRSLAAVLAWGVTPHEVLLQCLSRSDDPASGGRSMPNHYAHRARNVLSMSSPIGTQLPHAVGAALASTIRQQDSVTLVFFGDGASSKSDFHEALNFAAIRKLPVVFVCENNGWSISVPIQKQMAVRSVADRAGSYGMPGQAVDGTDPLAVFHSVSAAMRRARAGHGPSLIEARVVRLAPHSSDDDDARYRSRAERAAAARRDPLPRFARRLRRWGILDAESDTLLQDRVRQQVDAALAAAEASPEPTPASALDRLYAAGSNGAPMTGDDPSLS
jgi:2-oxoisovalerate dehydrogenase E1 component alpha subunit